ncbi:TetR/AcrR family transcriptional regulator [Mycolicibacterium aichiense]|uniref:Transcriptional regulatory protein TetR n=1 Tax=Mycolicibacterium aichiense TaxID=1799 RepID=A0AAD1HRL1_9MYCO|nr:helix-turn-helix domain-containing protein [Mycolicibacterium aichiense]MCV7017428.1 helix-turn-helix transcriptional regulator [Mycolicibacterium aichiense]BBX10139.1 putative transcriptional regulatory protein TetR [Mycolicibacterium aichiense]STZ26194.1 TetR family transcriptional regulator [Mycolicibacterium aichiense]
MGLSCRPLRADAARNRARVLQVAYEVFAEQGLAVPIDEIARRAGVGAGTVYRHFPTKEALFEAVISDRVRLVVARGRELLAADPSTALFEFLRETVRSGAADHGMVEALARYGIDLDSAAPGAEAEFLEVLGEMLVAAQQAGAARADVGVAELKALLVVCKSGQEYGEDVADRITNVIVAGLRAG